MPFFGLPGNPVSTMVTFQLFVRPVLDALAGAKPQALPFLQAELKSDSRPGPDLQAFSRPSWREQRKAGSRVGTLAGVR